MLSVFLLLCIAFNITLIAGKRHNFDYVSYVKEARKTTGRQMGAAFDRRAAQLPESGYKQILTEQTKGAVDIFEQYDAAATAQLYQNAFRIKGWVADALEWKYQKQEQRITELDRQDASLDVGAARMTQNLLDILFHQLCRIILAQGLLAAVFAALYICGHEQLHRTWMTVYASKRGRLVQREKLAAGALYAAIAYLAIAAISCTAYAAVWQLGDIWKTNMSTQFYQIRTAIYLLPFIPWATFTVQSYLAAVLALGLAVVLIFYLLGYCGGLLAKNSYAGFLLIFVGAALNFELILVTGDNAQWALYELALWSPAALWGWQPSWFSDMGIQALVPWQECLTTLFCLVSASALVCLGFRHFNKKDLK